jgi:tetratricopeptide (TPR) repeat protein
MADDNAFRSSLSDAPRRTPLSVEEAERLLLARLQACAPGELDDCLWQLARFYSQTGRQEIALQYLERLRSVVTDSEKLAQSYLAMGQMMEQLDDFAAAAQYYSQGLSLEPSNSLTWYLINNNLGYSLNQLGKYAEAEAYCRAAISIDPQRYNAYKNLGVAREGLGQRAQAAQSFIQAVKANAADPRALQHLEKLVAGHPELLVEIPDLTEQVQRCREAVRTTRAVRRGSTRA